MGALTFDALLRSRKQGGRDERGAGKGEAAPDAVYYLHGDEYVLKDEAVQALVDRVLDAGARDFNFDQRSAGELDAEAFHSLVNTPPLLAAVRVVVLRGVENVRKTSKVRQALVRYLQAPNPTTLLILVQGAGEPPDAELARSATTVAIEPLPLRGCTSGWPTGRSSCSSRSSRTRRNSSSRRWATTSGRSRGSSRSWQRSWQGERAAGGRRGRMSPRSSAPDRARRFKT